MWNSDYMRANLELQKLNGKAFDEIGRILGKSLVIQEKLEEELNALKEYLGIEYVETKEMKKKKKSP